MKNIHILSTDKPSRLYRNLLTDKLFILENSVMDVSECNREYQNIYITNDEEIKEGDWVYSEQYKSILQFKLPSNKYFYKKIILTTDLDLVKDGVQTIDDEFLKWFVKNPSCEKVDIENERVILDDVNYNFDVVEYKYKIIIPKEEPKLTKEFQECIDFNDKIYSKETLEEAIIKKFPKSSNQVIDFANQLRREGAKWQAKRSYSDEEVIDILLLSYSSISDRSLAGADLRKWFEQFKKK